MRTWSWFVAVSLVGTGSLAWAACDKGAVKGGVTNDVDAAPSAAPMPTQSARAEKLPEAPRAPIIVVDDRSWTIDGTTFTGAPSDWSDRAAALLAEKPLVRGEAVVVNVMRDTKTPKVAAIVAVLAQAKATRVVVRTPTRDQSTGELSLELNHTAASDCSVVAMIEHDGAVAVWSKSGGGAQRFARGMAGPDLTTATEALRKRTAACSSPLWFLGAADSISWGLTFDLALRAKVTSDAAPVRQSETVLVTHALTPGRRVTDD